MGIGPRNFINLFSLSLDVGKEVIRKDSDGKSYETKWNPKTATLRIRGTPSSYKYYEKEAANKIHQIKDDIGR